MLLNGASHAMATRGKEGCPIFEKFGEDVLDERELAGVRGIDQERRRFRKHLATAHYAKTPLDKITTPDGARWLRDMQAKDADDRRGKRKLGKSTIQRALALALAILDAAGPQNRGLIPSNPFLGLEARGREDKTRDPFTFLEPPEQEAVRAYVPRDEPYPMTEAERLAILFGAGCGVRQGEQFNLELDDLHPTAEEPHAIMRYGSPDEATKNGTIHEVPLFGLALYAAEEWLKIRTAFLTDKDGKVAKTNLVFCSPSGTRRAVGKPLGNGNYRRVEKGGTHVMKSGKPVRVAKGQGTHRYVDRLKEVLALCGITRNVRWHDLRHTCATSLIRGDWSDEPFELQEVSDMLNHSSTAVTERIYAHVGDTRLKKAARKVRKIGGPLVAPTGTNGGAGSSRAAISSEFNALAGVGPVGLEPTTYGLKEPTIVEILRGLTREKSSDNPLVTHLAEALAGLLEKTGHYPQG